jgi:hypothetical protein
MFVNSTCIGYLSLPVLFKIAGRYCLVTYGLGTLKHMSSQRTFFLLNRAFHCFLYHTYNLGLR